MSIAEVTCTFFVDYAASTKTERTLSVGALADRIRSATAPVKESLPWLKLGRFGDVRTAKNSLRHDGNLVAICGVEGDYDDGRIPFEEAFGIIAKAGRRAILYTSPSHTPAAPRWRVLCITTRNYPPEHRDKFMARLNGLFGGALSRESFTRSQAYYYGFVNQNPAHQVEITLGRGIDEAVDLDATAIGPLRKPNGDARPQGPVTPPENITDARVRGLIDSLLNNLRSARDGEKHLTLLRISRTVGGYLHIIGWSEAEAVEQLIAALPGTVQDWNLARRTAADGLRMGLAAPLDLTDRPAPGGATRRANGADKPDLDDADPGYAASSEADARKQHRPHARGNGRDPKTRISNPPLGPVGKPVASAMALRHPSGPDRRRSRQHEHPRWRRPRRPRHDRHHHSLGRRTKGRPLRPLQYQLDRAANHLAHDHRRERLPEDAPRGIRLLRNPRRPAGTLAPA
jgi:hypothetical protein